MQPSFLAAEMLLPVTGLSDILFLTVLVAIQWSCGVAFITCCLCWFEGLFSFFLELHQIQVHVVIQYMNPFTIVLLCRVNYICNILLVNVMFHSTRKKHIFTHQAFGVDRRVANKYRSGWVQKLKYHRITQQRRGKRLGQ